MKNRTVIFLLFFAAFLIFCAHDSSSLMRVMTFNVRVDMASDCANGWPYRKEMVASTIRFHHADLVGIQEALQHQVKDLADQLPMYNWVGVGRDDGKEAGEFMAIFYLKSRFEYKDGGTFWLSETPDRPGPGWDAACTRVVTWALFYDRQTHKTFYHFNTHFDHQGEVARQESAKLILSSIQHIAGSNAVVVTGDFNATPDSDVYHLLTRVNEDSEDFQLHDTEQAAFFAHHGPATTFNEFKLFNLTVNPRIIDYVFVTPHFQVLNHGTFTDSRDGRFPSDHFPVLAEIYISSS